MADKIEFGIDHGTDQSISSITMVKSDGTIQLNYPETMKVSPLSDEESLAFHEEQFRDSKNEASWKVFHLNYIIQIRRELIIKRYC